MPAVTKIGADLIEQAAQLFDNIGAQTPDIAEQMKQNAELFRNVGQNLSEDPTGSIEGQEISKLGANLLSEAAGFMRSVGAQNPGVQAQMDENASVYDKVAQLLLENPDLYLEDN